jgi:MOSC domain-containing protein YiiM
MKIVSLNAGFPRTMPYKGRTVKTAIFKEPVAGTARIRRHNLDGDAQADLDVHGGATKAVYGYPSEHYDFWRSELPGVDLPWGVFGENLTTEGLSEEDLRVGDTFRVGSAILRVTEPRVPCYKLALRFDREDIVKRFLQSGRSGFYFAVVEKGEAAAGAPVESVAKDPEGISIADLARLYRSKDPDPDLLRRALRSPALSEAWRAGIRRRLEVMETSRE